MSATRPNGRRHFALQGDIVTTPSGGTIRPELVARGKMLLAAGLVGADSRRLADRLIDLALEEGEWLWTFDR